MEAVHGVDVSWLHKTHTREKADTKVQSPPSPEQEYKSPIVHRTTSKSQNGNGQDQKKNNSNAATPVQTPTKPELSRKASLDKKSGSSRSAAPGVSRKNSWLSSIKSSFSSSPTQPTNNPSPSSSNPPNTLPDPRAPIGSPAKNTVLPPATQPVGASPYTPAPVRSQQPGFLQNALRRLSSTSGVQPDKSVSKNQYGLCKRQVLNVDYQRERCELPDLQQAKLRRVAFCVDVEIASVPKYVDEEDVDDDAKTEKNTKKMLAERSEGETMKHPQAAVQEKESDVMEQNVPQTNTTIGPDLTLPATVDTGSAGSGDYTRKREKKKRSEEERKARKEKKQRQAEANGTKPVEIVRNFSDSSLEIMSAASPPKMQASPTTDPARIYRRCCQLRETPILKKVTEQLAAPSNCDLSGVVAKLDLSGYWMQLPDLVTLGDFFAVVPVKEVVMEGCGLTDEGVRVILAGLLAARSPGSPGKRRYKSVKSAGPRQHRGVIERVILKNNSHIGREGWKHICLFIHMARSLKIIDMSMNRFPKSPKNPPASETTINARDMHADIAALLSAALETRLAGPELELLNISETRISAEQLGYVIDGSIKSGLCRLGLAGNQLDVESIRHVARYIREGRCEGLDLGGNDLTEHIEILADAFPDSSPLWALSLADCAFTPDALYKIIPSLAKLTNFRFIDLSHNHELFKNTKHSALAILRKYVPKMPIIKRIHLTDVALTPEQAIALAEVFAESSTLAHVNLMSNPELSVLADATNEAHQEEACALYASLMTAVKVSKSLVCIDIEVPGDDSSEIVKALAKQVVAYCLRNMERGPVAEFTGLMSPTDSQTGEKDVLVPDVLLHLVGHEEHQQVSDDDLAPDDDYMIGGTGVVKALGICLRNSGADSRRPSYDPTFSDISGASTPRPRAIGGKAKDMSKTLLVSARKIRARLQPALVKEAHSSNRMAHQRLLFLDSTLESMISRFENEYPETRLPNPADISAALDAQNAISSQASVFSPTVASYLARGAASDEDAPAAGAFSDEEDPLTVPRFIRHNSEISLVARGLDAEEGRMHRVGQQFRRDILMPNVQNEYRGSSTEGYWAPHLQMLRATLEELGGEEIRRAVREGGQAAVVKELNEEASVVRQRIIESDPEGWERFKGAQERMMRNSVVEGMGEHMSAIE